MTLLSAAPALSAPFNTSVVIGNAPLAIALGAGGFAVLALLALRKVVRDGKLARMQSAEQVAGLRALVDEYEALLSGAREITVLWTENPSQPKVFGQVSTVLPAGRRKEAMLDFANWLPPSDADTLARAVEGLRVRGQPFSLVLRCSNGQSAQASGAVLAGGSALRVRLAAEAATTPPVPAAPDRSSLDILLGTLDQPAFRREVSKRLGYANPAYSALATTLGRTGKGGLFPELLGAETLGRQLKALAQRSRPAPLPVTFDGAGSFELVETPLPGGGSVGYFRRTPSVAQEAPPGRTAALVGALPIPAAIFDARRELVAFNRPYADLWKLGDWLKPGLDERTILDRLRSDGMLPSEPDYQGWRSRHLAAYSLTVRRELDPWHLPDGRTLRVTAAPAGPGGGLIYLFEDISRELALVSQNKSLASVQRSTLNALSEAVAVFGTNGRLQLHNPRLSALWKLPTNFLEQNPHVDVLAEAAAKAMPDDAAAIWRDLKRHIIDLNPSRSDSSGRLTRADGRLLDYAVVRLPDGQKLVTFLDVTESANYSRLLRERNDALVTADRLKDAFVQNVSYELRSPLTNIIGFSDLLASPDIGPLNPRQRAYTDYIRASSVTLGVLIDNILDLATVDAGIAELRPEPQDVTALVDKARAGIAATFPEINGGTSVNLVVRIDPDLPAFIADGTRIVQVLYNLLSSAARFSEPGGEVRLTVSARGERMLFVVEDEGAAMSAEMKAAMLADGSAIAGRQRGAGLGLAIVRTFVNLHGGTITVEDRNPRGSRVVVSLPLDASAAAVTAAE